MVIVVCLEGNVGCGKSTILKGLQEHGFKVLQEPVDEWETYRDQRGGILEHMYENPRQWAFTFQVMCLHTRVKALEQALRECQEQNIPILIVERSLLTTYQVFTKVLIEEGLINPIEARIFRDIHMSLMGELNDMRVNCIYINTHPTYCFGRVKARGRKGEEHITMDYLNKLHTRHQQWLAMVNMYEINGDDIQENVLIQCLNYIRNLMALHN